MKDFKAKASKDSIEKASQAARANGFEVRIAKDGAEARAMVLSLLPAGAEVMTASSVTVDSIGLGSELNDSGKFDSVKARLIAMDSKVQGREMRRLGAAPDFAVGSAHALTESGSLVIASLTGSQLPAYSYGAGKVVWVVGSQKIVRDLEEAMRRIEEHIVPLESERARKAYGLPEGFRTFPSKVLVYNREVQPGRATIVIVEEPLGF